MASFVGNWEAKFVQAGCPRRSAVAGGIAVCSVLGAGGSEVASGQSVSVLVPMRMAFVLHASFSSEKGGEGIVNERNVGA